MHRILIALIALLLLAILALYGAPLLEAPPQGGTMQVID